MFDPLLDKSPAPPAAVATPPSLRPPPSVALAASPSPPSQLQSPAAPSPPPPMSSPSPTPPRSATAPATPTPQTTAPSASPSQQAEATPYTSLSRLLSGRERGGRRSGDHTDSSDPGDKEDHSVTLLGRLLRRRRKRNPTLPVMQPVSVPSSGGRASRIRAWFQTLRCDLLPDSNIQKRLAIFGFVLYGIMSLLPSTQKLIKGFPPEHQVAVLLVVGFIWTLSSTGARCCIFGRTSIEHTVAKLATWVGMLGITLLVIFHIGLMLPQNYWRKEGELNKWSAGGFVTFGTFCNHRPQLSIGAA